MLSQFVSLNNPATTLLFLAKDHYLYSAVRHTMIQYFLVSLILFSCTSSEKPDDEIKWTKPDLTGHWKLYNTEIVDEVPFLNLQAPKPDPATMVHEDSPWDSYVEYDLVFENDSMYMINYPIQASRPVQYSLDSGYIHSGPRDSINAYPVELVNDTLFLYRRLRSDPGFFKETYVRTSYNDSILGVMKKYGINYPELAGTWYLVRELDYDYGTHYELQFPYELPDSIVLTREQMIHALNYEKVCMMLTDGVKRDYTFYYHSPYIYFNPGGWCKEKDPWIFFSRYY